MLNSAIHTQRHRVTQTHTHVQIHLPPLFLDRRTVKAFWKNEDTFPFKHLSLGFSPKIGNQEGVKDNIQVVLEVAHREETWIGFYCG